MKERPVSSISAFLYSQDKDRVKRATEMRQKMDSSIIIKAKTPTGTPSGGGNSNLSTEVYVDPAELAREALELPQEDPNLELEGNLRPNLLLWF